MCEIRVAIVGAEERKWDEKRKAKAKEIIMRILLYYKFFSGCDVVLVSGRCPKGGVDIWAEEIADALGIKKLIFPPKKHSWYWYRKRNIQIAENCDILFDIEPEGKRSGGTWTLNYARKLGKYVYLIEV